jgi:lipopolysaccharide/colanic/teichoic acid biosynthesis glycosyltransferase
MSPQHRGRAYCRGRLKRSLDLAAAFVALILLAPVMALVAVLIRTTSGAPVLFRQERMGMDRRPFRILKFRTMRDTVSGPPITGRGDARVTRLGRLLRAGKIDEWPQLWNVVKGEMSLVGPRPELPRYAGQYRGARGSVLEVRPGLTDDATLLFRDEEHLLGQVPPEARELYYIEEILPRKLDLNLAYIERAGLGQDVWILLRTAGAIVGWGGR